MKRKEKILRDVTVADGTRYIEREIKYLTADGKVPECVRDCDFMRQGDCGISRRLGNDFKCQAGTYWSRVDKEGYILDRDGWRGWRGADESSQTRIDAERYRIDNNGNRISDMPLR